MHKICLSLLLLLSIKGYTQTIKGYISDDEDNSLSSVNISILNEKNGAISDKEGKYIINIKANRSVVLAYSFIGFKIEKIRIPMLKKGQIYELDINLKSSSTTLEDVIITDQKNRKESFNRIKGQQIQNHDP